MLQSLAANLLFVIGEETGEERFVLNLIILVNRDFIVI